MTTTIKSTTTAKTYCCIIISICICFKFLHVELLLKFLVWMVRLKYSKLLPGYGNEGSVIRWTDVYKYRHSFKFQILEQWTDVDLQVWSALKKKEIEMGRMKWENSKPSTSEKALLLIKKLQKGRQTSAEME